MPTETITFASADGLKLEGRLAIPDGVVPAGGAVVCHPHPQYGGTMSSRLVPAIQRALVNGGWVALRFNFRGVGRSEGSFEDGVGEVADVLGAFEVVRQAQDGPIAAVGWSFGALIALNATAKDGEVGSFTGVAPPARRAFTGDMVMPPVADLDGWKARALIVCGDNDPVCRPKDAEALAAQILPPAEVRVIQGADHFFTDREDELCRVVVSFVTGG
ncbi:MAG: alpha/beta fold hydrolase [Actinomycetota bacterium]